MTDGDPLKVFVSEFICGGAWPEPEIETSLAREGSAMLKAAVEDFARIENCQVFTTCDVRLGQHSLISNAHKNLHISTCESSSHELQLFRRFAKECDATFVIAPEFDGLLADRRRIVDEVGGRFLGPTLDAIELCGDKLKLAEFLIRHDIRTIPTQAFGRREENSSDGDFVIKPRFGAGSQFTFQLSQVVDLSLLKSCPMELIQQPYINGESISVAVIGSDISTTRLPMVEQRLSNDGRFHYLGSVIPSASPSNSELQRVVQSIAENVSGLSGYWGVDLIRTDDDKFVVVEINPRLTSSYLAYRQQARFNVASLLLGMPTDVAWIDQSVRYFVD